MFVICDWRVMCVQTWIRDKAKLIESTDELSNDLTGVITLQRRLSGLERDLAAIEAKVEQPFKLNYITRISKRMFRILYCTMRITCRAVFVT